MRLISWNIAGARRVKSHQHFDYGDEDLIYFSEQAKILHPDVICLQETHTNSQRSVAEDLAKSLKMDHVFDSPASPSHVDKLSRLGTAIISKTPFLNKEVFQYPYPDFELYFPDGRKAIIHHKNLQVVKFKDFYLANTQMLPIQIFGYQYGEGEAVEYTKKVESTFFTLKRPLIFAGDFNFDTPQAIYPMLRDRLALKDALPDRVTRPNKEGIKKTPDHIYYSPEFKLIDSRIVETETDHYLCFAELNY